MRRLIYSQLPLPLGTLPLLCCRFRLANEGVASAAEASPLASLQRGAVMAMPPPEVNQAHDNFDTPWPEGEAGTKLHWREPRDTSAG